MLAASVLKQQQGILRFMGALQCSWRSAAMGCDTSAECSSSGSSSPGDGTQCDQNHQVLYKHQHALWIGGCAPVSTCSNSASSDSSTDSSSCRRRQASTAATPSAPLHQQAPGRLLQAVHWQQPWAQQCHPHMMQACWAPPARSHAGISIHSRQQPLRCLHTQQQQQQQQQHQQQQPPPHKQQQEVLPGGSWTSPPNLLSLSRVAAAPLLVWLVLTEAWAPAVALVTAAGVSDWADGYLARRMGHTSVLGSYLDPLGDKIFVGALVGALGWQGSVPAWLVALVLGRDVALLGGMTVYRLGMFGGRWPGWRAFLDADGTKAGVNQQQQQQQQQAAGGMDGQEQQQKVEGQAVGGLPRMQPLFISKLNTALVFVLLGGAITQQWQGWPGAEVLQLLEWTVAGTTAASGVMYGVQYYKGQLLPARGDASR